MLGTKCKAPVRQGQISGQSSLGSFVGDSLDFILSMVGRLQKALSWGKPSSNSMILNQETCKNVWKYFWLSHLIGEGITYTYGVEQS